MSRAGRGPWRQTPCLRMNGPLLTTALAGLVLTLAADAVLLAWFVGAAAGSALALALVARRASRVISRKMAPLAEAAGRVGAGELDFAVGNQCARGERRPRRDGRHADLPRRVARGPLGR